MPAVLIRRTVRRPASLAPAVKASCLTVRSRVAMTVPMQVLAQVTPPATGALVGQVVSGAALIGRAFTRRPIMGQNTAGGVLAGAAGARLALNGPMQGGAVVLAQPSLRLGLSGSISAEASLSDVVGMRRKLAGELKASGVMVGSAFARLVLSGHVTVASDLSGASDSRLAVSGELTGLSLLGGSTASRRALSGNAASLAALAGSVSARLGLMGSVSAGAVLSGTPSLGSTPDPLRGGWDTTALEASAMTFSNNDRTVVGNNSGGFGDNRCLSKASKGSGKWFSSVRIDAREYGDVSVCDTADAHYVHYAYDGTIWSSAGSVLGTLSGYSAPCVIDQAVDTDNHLVWFRLNGGNWNGNASNNPDTGTGGYALPASTQPYHVKAQMPYFPDSQRTLNTGTASFTYPPPVSFPALQT